MNENISLYQKIPKHKLISFIIESNVDISKKELAYIRKLKKNALVLYVFKNIPKSKLKQVDYFEKFENKKHFNYEKKLGLNKLTKEEILNYDYKENVHTDPFIGKTPLLMKKGVLPPIVNLLEHQKKFLMGFFVGNLRSSIVFHGVGTGKTFTAVATCNMYLQLYPKNKVIFISPPAILYNFIESLFEYGIDARDPRFTYFTYDKWYRSKMNATDCLLVVDEAHNFRTEIIETTRKNEQGIEVTEYIQNKKGASLLNRGGMFAHKVLLLTATPFVNKLYDIENLLSISDGKEPINPDTFGEICSNKSMRHDYFAYRISQYKNASGDSNFPERRESYVPIIVPEGYESDIRASYSKENPFYIHSRQISSKADSLKCNYVIKEILDNPSRKFVCYTTFEDSGYKPLEDMLAKNGIKYAMITGKDSANKKKMSIDSYNNYGNDNFLGTTCRVIIITRAGAEGVDLKRTYTIYILDGQWNDALYEQIVARAIRYKSHADLPISERYVNVKKIFVCYAVEAKILNGINKGGTVDYRSILNSILETKDEEKDLNKIQNNRFSNKAQEEFVKKMQTFATLDYDPEVLKTLKKGSKERRQYLENNEAYAKNREKYLTAEMSNIIGVMPSTDFYMFILQKNKQLVIDTFITELSRIPSTEKSVYDLDFGKKIFEDIQKQKIDGKQLIGMLYEHLQKDINKVSISLKKTIINNENKLEKHIEQQVALNNLQKKKNIVRIGQEYFTPQVHAEKLIKLSYIEIDAKKVFNGSIINILEPTAGQGSLVFPLLELMKRSKVNLRIDLVEFAEDNRKFLKSTFETVPDIIQLQKTTDFLEYIPNKTYQYIFMNPPFHLDKRLNKKYKKDYYDYDFIKRAYAMLDLHGVLVAITGQKWKENKDIVAWYQSKNAKIQDDVVRWEGDNLKEGASVNALKISFIFIRKINNDMNENNELLRIDDFNKSAKELDTEYIEPVIKKLTQSEINDMKKTKSLINDIKVIKDAEDERIRGIYMDSLPRRSRRK